MTYTLTVPTITDDTIWFPSRESWIAYWAQAFINVNASDLDAATVTTYGVVKKSVLVGYTDTTVTLSYQQFIDGEGSTISVPDGTSFAALKSKVDALGVSLANLLTALQNAGIMSTT